MRYYRRLTKITLFWFRENYRLSFLSSACHTFPGKYSTVKYDTCVSIETTQQIILNFQIWTRKSDEIACYANTF